MENQTDKKPVKSVELSLSYMSWSVKEIADEFKKLQAMTDQKLSEIVSQLREINKSLSSKKKEETPF